MNQITKNNTKSKTYNFLSLKTLKDASSNAGVLSSGNTGSGWIKLSSFCSEDQIKY